MAAMTLTSAISAQRHSPEVTGEAARSADDIFFIRGRKRSMSGQSSLTVELGDLSFEGREVLPAARQRRARTRVVVRRVAQDPLAPERVQRSRRPSGVTQPRS